MPILGNVNTILARKNVLPLPLVLNPLFYLDGTLKENSDTYYLKDKSGNDRHFEITGYDWESFYYRLPFKTAATIKAPAGDTELQNADVNNFLYQSDGTPNELPPQAFFQNIDFANKLFCRHEEHVLNINNREIRPAGVKDIVLYDTAKIGSELTNLNSYYSVPEKDDTAYWVDPQNGSDDTGDGSESNPWQTVNYASSNIADNATVYIMTGLESNDWTDNSYTGVHYLCIGKFEKHDGASRCIQSKRENTFSHFLFKLNDSTNTPFYIRDGKATIKKCWLDEGGSERSIWPNGGDVDIYDSYAKGTLRSMAENTIINKYRTYGLHTVYYSDIGVKINSQYCEMTEISNIYEDIDTFNFTYDTCYGKAFVIQQNDNLSGNVNIEGSVLHATEEFSGLTGKDVGTDATLTYSIKNSRVYNEGYDNVFLCTGISYNPNGGIIEKNIFIPDDIADKTKGISLSYNGTTAVWTIKGNLIHKKKGTGAICNLGNGETDGSIDDLGGTVFSENKLFGPDYYGNTGTGSHSILLLNQLSIVIKHNRFYENHLGIVVKSEHSNPQSFQEAVRYNVVTNTYCVARGIKNVKWYNNTIINGFIQFLTTGGTNNEAQDGDVKNNIIISDTPIKLHDDSEVGFSCDYNIYYSPSGNLQFDYKETLITFSEWQALGYDQNSIVLTDEEYNNLFNFPDNDDYSLKNGSKAIRAGTDLGTDYNTGLDEATDWGSENETSNVVTKEQSGDWDIGAYVK